jgi:hypothetical protein
MGRRSGQPVVGWSQPLKVKNQTALIVGVSIGISVAPVDGLDPDALLKNAEIAL